MLLTIINKMQNIVYFNNNKSIFLYVIINHIENVNMADTIFYYSIFRCYRKYVLDKKLIFKYMN